jgi:hypothetical protein
LKKQYDIIYLRANGRVQPRREAQRSGVGWNAVLARALPTKMTLCHLEPKRIWR